jgi:MFS family permease
MAHTHPTIASPPSRWRGWLWDSADVSKEERRFLFKLDATLLTFGTPAHIWIPFQEIGWTVFTFALAGAKSYRALLGLRFIVGLFEAGYWPALYYVLGSWYNKRTFYLLFSKFFQPTKRHVQVS